MAKFKVTPTSFHEKCEFSPIAMKFADDRTTSIRHKINILTIKTILAEKLAALIFIA